MFQLAWSVSTRKSVSLTPLVMAMALAIRSADVTQDSTTREENAKAVSVFYPDYYRLDVG